MKQKTKLLYYRATNVKIFMYAVPFTGCKTGNFIDQGRVA